jgi:hypothetical protein
VSAVAGTLQADGAPVAGATVVAAAGDAVLASALTGEDGGFALDVDAARVRLFARAGAGDVAGVAAREVEPPATVRLALEDHAPLHDVTVLAVGDVPPELDVQLAPQRIAGIDLLFGDDPVLVRRPPPLRLRLQAGSWLVYAAHETVFDARDAGAPAFAWRVERAVLDDGTELPDAVVGHALEVARALTVTLHVVRRAT